MTETTPQPRWFRFTPDRLVWFLLVVETALWLSVWPAWPEWHNGYAEVAGIASIAVVLLVMLVWLSFAIVFRRRFQFTLGSLLLLTIAVAIPCGRLGEMIREARPQREALLALQNHGCRVVYSSQRTGPECLSSVLSVYPVNQLYLSGKRITNADLEQLKHFTNLGTLILEDTSVTDGGLKNLNCLGQLRLLDLNGSRVTMPDSTTSLVCRN